MLVTAKAWFGRLHPFHFQGPNSLITVVWLQILLEKFHCASFLLSTSHTHSMRWSIIEGIVVYPSPPFWYEHNHLNFVFVNLPIFFDNLTVCNFQGCFLYSNQTKNDKKTTKSTQPLCRLTARWLAPAHYGSSIILLHYSVKLSLKLTARLRRWPWEK